MFYTQIVRAREPLLPSFSCTSSRSLIDQASCPTLMSNASNAASGSRFARDMKRIREEQEVSLADIHEETMIPGELIRSFEEHGLLEHPRFNRVYLRSFVRSYAQCVNVDADTALSELQRALDGAYTNQLAVAYLDEEPADPDGSDEEEPASPVEPDATESTSSFIFDSAAEAPREQKQRATEEQTGVPAGGGWHALLIGLGIVLILILAWIGFSLLNQSDSEDAASESTSQQQVEQPLEQSPVDTTDTASAPAETTMTQPQEPRAALGDTLYFTLVADKNKIEAVRIRRDGDLRRPYWIEQGETAAFPAQQQITIEPLEDHFQLLVNGYPWPRRTQDQLVLTRSDVRSFLDTASVAPVDISADTTFHIPGT